MEHGRLIPEHMIADEHSETPSCARHQKSASTVEQTMMVLKPSSPRSPSEANSASTPKPSLQAVVATEHSTSSPAANDISGLSFTVLSKISVKAGTDPYPLAAAFCSHLLG
jgi:hypothetical protein